jgi:3D (Asp-Asp-Asp) domain-containing protein
MKMLMVYCLFLFLVTFSMGMSNPKVMEYKAMVTAYCPCELCCGQYADGITSTGKDASTVGLAVDPRIIPYGSKVDIGGIVVKADDTGSAMLGRSADGAVRVDLRLANHYRALQWGRREMTILVYPEGE